MKKRTKQNFPLKIKYCHDFIFGTFSNLQIHLPHFSFRKLTKDTVRKEEVKCEIQFNIHSNYSIHEKRNSKYILKPMILDNITRATNGR